MFPATYSLLRKTITNRVMRWQIRLHRYEDAKVYRWNRPRPRANPRSASPTEENLGNALRDRTTSNLESGRRFLGPYEKRKIERGSVIPARRQRNYWITAIVEYPRGIKDHLFTGSMIRDFLQQSLSLDSLSFVFSFLSDS